MPASSNKRSLSIVKALVFGPWLLMCVLALFTAATGAAAAVAFLLAALVRR
jgi:hypothetical protein